jgi:hypothetical protein
MGKPKAPSLQLIEDLESGGSMGFHVRALEDHAEWVRWAVAELVFRKRRIEELEDELYGED